MSIAVDERQKLRSRVGRISLLTRPWYRHRPKYRQPSRPIVIPVAKSAPSPTQPLRNQIRLQPHKKCLCFYDLSINNVITSTILERH
jgi:hypothetical protein